MASKTEIANMAISHLGIGATITNLDSDTSQEAQACRVFYETAKKATLKGHDWSFAWKEATLNLVEENPVEEWSYSYRYPSDAVSIRRIVSGFQCDTLDTVVPYTISSDSSGKLIYTDREEAKVQYTIDANNVDLYTPRFTLALSFQLAYYIAPRITGGDPFKAKADMLAQYKMEIGEAAENNMNEERRGRRPDSEFVSTRGG